MVDTAGREVSHKYSDNEFIATAGQKVSSIWSDQYWVLLSYNHATGVLAAPAWWVKTMHTPPFWRTYLLMVPIAGGIATAVAVSVWPLLPGTKLHLVEQISILRDAMLVVPPRRSWCWPCSTPPSCARYSPGGAAVTSGPT